MMPNTDVLLHWAVLDIQQFLTNTGYRIVVTTNHPCHLWLRYTQIETQKHIVFKIQRGVAIGKGARFCLVAYEDNEQEETGDTLIHTFWKEPWPSCQTRWFYFYGTVNGINSPSESPIFTKHRTGDFGWGLLELWHVDYEPPSMRKWQHELWTYHIVPPDMQMLLKELWS